MTVLVAAQTTGLVVTELAATVAPTAVELAAVELAAGVLSRLNRAIRRRMSSMMPLKAWCRRWLPFTTGTFAGTDPLRARSR